MRGRSRRRPLRVPRSNDLTRRCRRARPDERLRTPSLVRRLLTGLDPGLVRAFGRARAEAAGAGHDLVITSGFRTAAEQAAMLEAEVAKRGSLGEALWWVL